MGVHQVLMVRPDARGRSGLPRGRTSVMGRQPGTRVGADPTSPYPWGAALTNLWVTALVVVATFAVALFVAVRVRGGRHDGIDVVWGMGFAIVAIVTLVLAHGAGDLLAGRCRRRC